MTVTTTLNSGGSEFDYKLGSVLRKRSMIATGLGNCLEWFDWTIYAIFASYIAKAMFDPRDPASALLGTLAIFAVGFISRPLGGIVFGTLSDSRGRKAVLLISMLLMGIGSLVIAVAPSYASIGVLRRLLFYLPDCSRALHTGVRLQLLTPTWLKLHLKGGVAYGPVVCIFRWYG